MSNEYVLALVKPLPTLEQLAEVFADFGGAEGGWDEQLSIGTCQLETFDSDLETEGRLAQALLAAGKRPLRKEHQLCSLRGSSDVDEVARRLVRLAGGAFMTEGGELLDHAAAPRRVPAPAPLALDVSIPDRVRSQFGCSQAPYCLYPRTASTVRVAALMKAARTPAEKSRSPRYAGTTHLLAGVGSVHLNEYGSADVAFWEAEYAELDLPQPQSLYRVAFESWHVKSVPDDDWEGMLSIVCGLARSCDGVIYRPGGRRFDFTHPEAPAPARSDEDTAAARALLQAAGSARGAALLEALEGLARLEWTGALDTLSLEDLCTRADRGAVTSVWKFLAQRR
jgi:hypothetical protein